MSPPLKPMLRHVARQYGVGMEF